MAKRAVAIILAAFVVLIFSFSATSYAAEYTVEEAPATFLSPTIIGLVVLVMILSAVSTKFFPKPKRKPLYKDSGFMLPALTIFVLSLAIIAQGHVFRQNQITIQLLPTTQSVAGVSDSQNIHPYTNLPLTLDGWTDFKALYNDSDYYNDARIVYVSAVNGNDSTGQNYTAGDAVIGSDPFNPVGAIQPYATIAQAYSQLRDGYPDMLLLKRGETWGETIAWKKSGRSQKERMIFGAYGSLSLERPIIGTFNTSYGPSKPADAFDYFAFLSISVTNRINWEIGGSHILLEDCSALPGENSGAVLQGLGEKMLENVVIRRCSFIDRYPNYPNTGHTQGIFISGLSNLVLEENIFDRNGWDPRASSGLNAGNIHSHNTYITTSNTNVLMRYNISTRANSHGFQMGAGGTLYANLSFQDSIAIQMSRPDHIINGFSGDIKQNVVLDSKPLHPEQPPGWGINVQNTKDVSVVENIIGDSPDASIGIQLRSDWRYDTINDVQRTLVKDNIIHNSATYPIYVRYVETVKNGERPFVLNSKLVGNKIHSDSGTLIMVQGNGDREDEQIIESKNNVFNSARTESDWFRRSGAKLGLTEWAAQEGDTTSVVGQTNPSGDYSITAYLKSIGETATEQNFYNNIRQQRKGNWDSRFTALPIINFVRSKFGLSALPAISYIKQSSPAPESRNEAECKFIFERKGVMPDFCALGDAFKPILQDGKFIIRFKNTIDFSSKGTVDFSRLVTGEKSVTLDGADVGISLENEPAEIEISGLQGHTDPVLYKDGVICEECTRISFNKESGVAIFEVPGF